MQERNGRFLVPEIPIDTSDLQRRLMKAGFDPMQPRDECGRWACEGNGSNLPALFEQIQYRGHFHDFMVNHLLKNLTDRGVSAIKNVEVTGVNGVSAIPDGATLIPGQSKPYFIEVKTGFDPDFTANQKQVYPLICMGGHAMSLDPRLRDLGLTPGKLLPPLDIMVAYVSAPGFDIRAESYCQMYGFWSSPNAH